MRQVRDVGLADEVDEQIGDADFGDQIDEDRRNAPHEVAVPPQRMILALSAAAPAGRRANRGEREARVDARAYEESHRHEDAGTNQGMRAGQQLGLAQYRAGFSPASGKPIETGKRGE